MSFGTVKTHFHSSACLLSLPRSSQPLKVPAVGGIVLIDSTLPDIDMLLNGMSAGWHPLLIDRKDDALAVLLEYATAQAKKGYLSRDWSLSLVGHGGPGRILFGNTYLTASEVRSRLSEWNLLRPSLIEIYSCGTGADTSLQEALHCICDVPVYASSGPVGSNLRGGDWTLDVKVGGSINARYCNLDFNCGCTSFNPFERVASMRSSAPFSLEAQKRWHHVLGSIFNFSAIGTGGSSNAVDALNTLLGNGNTVNIVDGVLPLSLSTGSNIANSEIIKLSGGIGYSLDISGATNVSMRASQRLSAISLIGDSSDKSISLALDPWESSLQASILNTINDSTAALISVTSIPSLSGSAIQLMNAYTNGSGVTGLGNENIFVSDASLAATILNTLNLSTSGLVTASSLTSLTGSMSDVYQLYLSSQLGQVAGLGSANITISGSSSASDIRELSPYTTGTISASIQETSTLLLKETLPDELNALSITLTDTVVEAADLNVIDSRTSLAVNASSLSQIVGSQSSLTQAFASSANGQILGLGNEDIVLSDSAVSASALNELDRATSGSVNASIATTVSGAIADLNAALAAPGIVGLGNENILVQDASVSATLLNSLNSRTTGVVNAASVSTLVGFASEVLSSFTNALSGEISGLGNETISLSNSSLVANYLNQLDALTTGTINASEILSITGSYFDINKAYGSAGISGLGNEAVTLSDTSLPVSSISGLSGLLTKTSGPIDLSSVLSLSGTSSSLLAAYAAQFSSLLFGLGNEDLNISDTVSISNANLLDQKTSGQISGFIEASSLSNLINSLSVDRLNLFNLTINDNSVVLNELTRLLGITSGSVNASTLINLTGTIPDFLATYAATGTGRFVGLGNEDLIATDSSLADAKQLKDLILHTSGTVSIANLSTLYGTSADVASIIQGIEDGSIVNLRSDLSVTLSPTSAIASELLSIDQLLNSSVDAQHIATLSGTAAQIKTAYASSGIDGLGNETVVLSDVTLGAAELNEINTSTTGTVNASSLTTLTGSAIDVNSAYIANGSGVSGLGNENVIISDTTLSGLDLNTLNSRTTGVVNASTLTTLSGSAVDINASYGAGAAQISGLGNEAIVLSDGSVSAVLLNALNSATTGVVNANSVTTISGSALDVNASYGAGISQISNLGNETIELNDTALAASLLNIIDNLSTGNVNAGSVTVLSGTAAQIKTAYSSPGIDGLGNETVVLSDVTLGAAALNEINANTTGTVNASSLTTLTGSAIDVNSAYNGSGVSGLGNEFVVLLDQSLSALELLAINNRTSGTVDAKSVDTIEGSAIDIGALFSAGLGQISGLGNEKLILTNADLPADQLKILDLKTTELIDATDASSLYGTLADLYQVVGAQSITIGSPTIRLMDSDLVPLSVTSFSQDIFSRADNKNSYWVSYTGDGGDNSFVGTPNPDILKGSIGADLLNGASGNDTLDGGLGADTLNGGAGADTFLYVSFADSLLLNMDRIEEFAIGQDRINGPYPVSSASLKELGSVSALSQAAIASVLSGTNFGAKGAATFTFSGSSSPRTFLALNNNLSGYQSSSDSIIEITGYSGSLGDLSVI